MFDVAQSFINTFTFHRCEATCYNCQPISNTICTLIYPFWAATQKALVFKWMLIGLVQQHTKLPTKNFIGQNARYLSFRIAKRVAKKKCLCSDLYVNEEPVFSLKTLLWCSIQQKNGSLFTWPDGILRNNFSIVRLKLISRKQTHICNLVISIEWIAVERLQQNVASIITKWEHWELLCKSIQFPFSVMREST